MVQCHHFMIFRYLQIKRWVHTVECYILTFIQSVNSISYLDSLSCSCIHIQ